MTSKLLKFLFLLKGKGLHVFLSCILIFAFCFHGENPSAEAAQESDNEPSRVQERALLDSAETEYQEAVTAFFEPVPKTNKTIIPDILEAGYESAYQANEASDTETDAEPVPEETTEETSEEEIDISEETTAKETTEEETLPEETAATEEPAEIDGVTEALPAAVQISGNYGQRYQEQWEIDYANQLFDLVNNERAKYGLSPLKKLDSLTAAATERAWEITIYTSHTRPNGTSCFTVLTEHGLSLSGRAENIAYCSSTPQSAFNSLMGNWAHREPMLNSKYEYMGVGFYYVPNGAGGYSYYWTQIFYTP